MNPLFILGEEFRFHDSSRFRKKAGDAKLPFYKQFCSSFDVFSCGVLPESGGVGTPDDPTWGIGVSQGPRPDAWTLGTLWKSLEAKIVTRGKIISSSLT